jgi:IPT/TIG domain
MSTKLFSERIWIIAVFCMTACSKSTVSPTIVSFNPPSGGAGNTITIRGNNFGSQVNAAIVFFNRTATIPVSVQDTIIMVNVPPGATTGKITVTIQGQDAKSQEDFIIVSGRWTRMADLPFDMGQGRTLSTAFSLLGKGYFGTGYDGGTYTKDLYQYDPANNHWTQKADWPLLTIESAVCMIINDKAYVGIGKITDGISISETTNQMWEYDPVIDSWSRKADLPDTLMEGAFGVGIGNRGYAGLSQGKYGSRGWWEYNPVSDSWIRKADYPGPRMDWACGFALHGKVYAGLGNISQSGDNNEWWQYDTTSDSWVQKKIFPGIIPSFGAGFAINEKGYVAGGNECWEYDDASDQWNQKSFYDFRTGGSTFVIGNKGYYVAGRGGPIPNNFLQKDLWEFDPAK